MWGKTLKQINLDVPKQAVKLWNGSESSLELVSDGINLVYRFDAEDNVRYLRITHEKLRSVGELEAAIHFQNYLAKNGVSVCKPIPSINHLLD